MIKSQRKYPPGYFDDPGPFWTPDFLAWLEKANSIESQIAEIEDEIAYLKGSGSSQHEIAACEDDLAELRSKLAARANEP